MTDRDHFAAAALTGLLAAPTDKDRSWGYWARCAYESADAMLDERKEKRAEVSSQTCSYVVGRTTLHCSLTPFTLTDEERRTLRDVRDIYADEDDVRCNEMAAVIDGLLERAR